MCLIPRLVPGSSCRISSLGSHAFPVLNRASICASSPTSRPQPGSHSPSWPSPLVHLSSLPFPSPLTQRPCYSINLLLPPSVLGRLPWRSHISPSRPLSLLGPWVAPRPNVAMHQLVLPQLRKNILSKVDVSWMPSWLHGFSARR